MPSLQRQGTFGPKELRYGLRIVYFVRLSILKDCMDYGESVPRF